MSRLHPGSIGALTLCKCRPALAQAPPLLGLDQRFESRSSLTEKYYIRNFVYLTPYDQRIQQRVKGVGYMGGKWARSCCSKFGVRFFGRKSCQSLWVFCLPIAYSSMSPMCWKFVRSVKNCWSTLIVFTIETAPKSHLNGLFFTMPSDHFGFCLALFLHTHISANLFMPLVFGPMQQKNFPRKFCAFCLSLKCQHDDFGKYTCEPQMWPSAEYYLPTIPSISYHWKRKLCS